MLKEVKMKYILAAALLLASGTFAYSEIAKTGQCSPGQIVKINLTDKYHPDSYRLNVPCEFFPNAFKNDGDHKNIQINFFKDTLEPAWPWHVKNSEHLGDWREDEIKIYLSRASNPDMINDSRKSAAPYFTKVTAPEVLKEMEGFDVLVSIHSKYPSGPYILYPKDEEAPQTEIKCIYSTECKILRGTTYYKGISLRYDIKKPLLQQWMAIEDQAKTLVDKFAE